jgi:Glycosyl transferases group 1
MEPVLFIPSKYDSRYSLLGAFCREVGEAAREMGIAVNPGEGSAAIESIRGGGAIPVFLMFNMPGDPAMLGAWMNAHAGVSDRAVLVQWMVDHPLNADARLLKDLAPQSGFRFACVSDDDLHLLQMRWGGIRRMRLWHGVSRSALVDVDSVADSHASGRDVDVLLAGSIASEGELEKMRAGMPAGLHKGCDGIVQLRLEQPWTSFGQAFDLSMPAGLHCEDMWSLMAAVFRYTTARVNRERRLGVLRALRGLNVTVLGSEAWREHVDSAGARLVGEVKYEELALWAARSKVWIGVNPTQFVHAFSERLLVGMAGGAACVSDDREWVRREFAQECVRFDVRDRDGLRDRVGELLRDGSRRTEVALAGRRAVEARHMWGQRVGEMLGMMGMKA